MNNENKNCDDVTGLVAETCVLDNHNVLIESVKGQQLTNIMTSNEGPH